MKTYSTKQVTQIVGLSRRTLTRWLGDGKMPSPRMISNGGVQARIWTTRDVERLRKLKAKIYRKGRGVKKKSKA